MISVPPKLLSREMLSTRRVSPIRACVFTYTLRSNVPAALTPAETSNELDHTFDTCAVETLPRSANWWPAAQIGHCRAVTSCPESIVRLVALSKWGSKYSSASVGAVSLANRLTSAESDSMLFVH